MVELLSREAAVHRPRTASTAQSTGKTASVKEDSTWTSTLGRVLRARGRPLGRSVATPCPTPVAVPVAVATEVPVRVMVVFDYLRWSEQDAALVEIQSAFQRSLPGLSVAMRGCWGPFEDSEGLASHFDGGANRLAGTERVKRLRVDLLTSCAKVLREATGFKPQFLVGLGQGGLVAAVLRWPLVVELTLQARNLQRKEARAAGEAWAGIKAIWVLRPRLWRTQCGHQEIAESCPELQREFPEPPLRGFGVVGKIAAGDEVLRLLRLDPSKGIEEASIRGMLEEPSREMWDHDGLCACGKRTYLFSRRPACIEQEALDTAVEIAEREDEDELLTQHLVLTKWDHLASRVRVKVDPKSFAYPMEVSGRSSSRAAGDPGKGCRWGLGV